METKQHVDPFTIEVVKDGLTAVGDEMFETLLRTSMSPIIYEVLDFASGLTDAQGRLVTQGQGVTGFHRDADDQRRGRARQVGGPPRARRHRDHERPLHRGGSHLSDVSLVAPIFIDGELAFAVSKAHWTEVGGMSPGSFTTDSTEIYQEGLQFPNVKIWSRGERNDSLVEVIASNVRTPEQTIGDLMAQAAAMRAGERAFREVCDKYGTDVVLETIDALIAHGETIARLELGKLPKGTFEAVDYIDDDGLGGGLRGSREGHDHRRRVRVRLHRLAPTGPRTGQQHLHRPPVGGPGRLQGGHEPGRGGQPRLVRAAARHLSVGHDPLLRAPCALLDLLGGPHLRRRADLASTGPALADRLGAGHMASVVGTIVAGPHADTGDFVVLVEPEAGGWGANPTSGNSVAWTARRS